MSPVAVLDGPLGLEAVHNLGGIDLNQQGVLPYFKLEKITGLHDVSDADDPRAPLPNEIGEVAYPALRRGKTVTYSGKVIGATRQDIRYLATQLRGVASSLIDTHITITPDPAYGTVVMELYGRPSAFTCDDDLTSFDPTQSRWRSPFVLAFRMRDPRAWIPAQVQTASAGSGGTATLTLPGNAPSEPVFSIAGPASGAITLTHLGQAKALRFLGTIPLGGGQTLLVDFGPRTATIGGVDVSGYVDWSVTDWWDRDAVGVGFGTNLLQVTGAGAFTVSAIPAVW
jgi:hypothetical protein